MNFLYHGSTTQGIKKLEPKKRYTPSGAIGYAAIYATPLPAFAAAHAFPWGSDEGFDLEVIDDRVLFKVPKDFKERLLVPISIYKLSDENFFHTKEELTGCTWHTTQPVEVMEEVIYPTVEKALVELGGSIEYI